jgi:hypothetical protein
MTTTQSKLGQSFEVLHGVIDEMFDKLAKACKYYDEKNDKLPACLYEGLPAERVCTIEICPLLKKSVERIMSKDYTQKG